MLLGVLLHGGRPAQWVSWAVRLAGPGGPSVLLHVEDETCPTSGATLTPDQPNFVYTATFLCLGNAKFFFFPLKFSFLITWCLLLLLLTAEFDLLEPVVACISVYFLFIHIYMHICLRIVPLIGLLGLTQQCWISLARH